MILDSMDWSALPIKRIAIVSSLILLIGGVFFALWAVNLTPVSPPEDPSGLNPPVRSGSQSVGGLGNGTAPGSDNTITAPITPEPLPATRPVEDVILSDYVINLASHPNGGVVAFNPMTSTFIQVNARGTVTNMSEERFIDVRGVTWSHDRTVAVIEDANGKNVYNFNTKERIALPNNWEEFSFSPDNNSIAFKNLGRINNTKYLATSNLKTGKITLVAPLGTEENRVHVDWAPTNTSVGFTTIPIDGQTQELSFIAPDGSFASSTTIEGAFFQSRWADTGKLFIFSTNDIDNNLKPRLWVGLGDGQYRGAYQELSLTTTAQQCSFGGKNAQLLVCAVPDRSSTANYGILGQIPNVPHSIVMLDLATGIPKTLYTPETNSTLKNPVVDKGGKKIYFTNVTSGQLESISLPQK